MKFYHFCMGMLCVSGLLFQQYATAQPVSLKPALELKDMNNWPEVSHQKAINADGEYVLYFVENEIPGKKIMHLRAVNNQWEKKMEGILSADFSTNGKLLLGTMEGGKLFMLNPGSDKIETIGKVSSYSLFSRDNVEYLLYHLEDKSELVIRNLKTGKEQKYHNCSQGSVSPDGKTAMIIHSKLDQYGLTLINLQSSAESMIWTGAQPSNIVFDKTSTNLAFTTEEQGSGTTVWIYKRGNNKVEKVLDDKSAGFNNEYKLTSISRFIGSGKSLEFYYAPVKAPEAAKKLAATVEVYSHTDKVPYTLQKDTGPFSGGSSFAGIFNIEEKKIVFKQQKGEWYGIPSEFTDGHASLTTNANLNDHHGKPEYYLMSTVDGKRTRLQYPVLLNYAFSPDAKYVLLEKHGETGNNFYSYEISTGITRGLSLDLPIPAKDTSFINPGDQRSFRLAAWIEGTTDILMIDNYDIWKIDIAGKRKPVNITNGYGRANRIIFNIANINFPTYRGNEIITKKMASSPLILSSYSYNTAANDYYSVELNRTCVPKKLTDGPYMYETVEIRQEVHRGGSSNRKAAKSNVYMIARQNASESMNIFTTTDFKNFNNISNNYPEKKYNWLTSEMATYRTNDGRTVHGVLYKPENFDSTKKYPVIFYFYLKLSQDLHRYREPALSRAVINIPYYVSNDYLVFTPDLEARFGKGIAAKDALNSILGGADYLAGKSWVDSSKLAVHGHSWGGFLCNYFVANSNRFAAAVSGSGLTDHIGAYGLTTHGGIPNFSIAYDQSEGSIYDNLDAYVKNSPKLNADKINSPFLIMHNHDDGAVLFQHSISLFYSMWKLGKPVWLLQYDGENHTIEAEANKLDYTIRVKQFFDHYLKNRPAPKWMAKGLPFKLKGVEDGLEIEETTAQQTK